MREEKAKKSGKQNFENNLILNEKINEIENEKNILKRENENLKINLGKIDIELKLKTQADAGIVNNSFLMIDLSFLNNIFIKKEKFIFDVKFIYFQH